MRAAAALLALLYSAALFAPLLAGDLPLYLRARDHGAIQAAQAVVGSIAEQLEQARLAGDGERAARERDALETRLVFLEQALEPGPASLSVSAAFVALQGLHADLGAALAGVAAAEPRARLRTSFPALAALSLPERLACLTWFLLLCAWAVGRRLNGRARSTALRAAGLACVAACALAVTALLGWTSQSGERGGASLKQRLQAGSVEVEQVVLPPLFYGVAETHTSEAYRPPTWLDSSRRDAQGRGPRSELDHSDPALRGLVRAATPIEVRFGEPALNAPTRHLLGTDALGRDLAVRLLWGARVSLVVGLAAAALLTALGLLLGGLAGFLGGATDFVVARMIELVLAFPTLFLIVLAAAYSDPQSLSPLLAIVGIIALVSWTGVARLVRAEMLRLRVSAFVLAARAQGLPRWRVALVHALPNALSPVLVAATFAVGAAILTESVVSYLGFGVRHPWPSWGGLIGETQSPQHWWLQVFAGLLIFATVSAFNLLGEALRDALDPRGLESPR